MVMRAIASCVLSVSCTHISYSLYPSPTLSTLHVRRYYTSPMPRPVLSYSPRIPSLVIILSAMNLC